MTPYRAIWWDHLLETQGEEAAFAWGEMYERSPEEWEMGREIRTLPIWWPMPVASHDVWRWLKEIGSRQPAIFELTDNAP